MHGLHLPPRPWPQAVREQVVRYGFELGSVVMLLLVIKDVFG